MANSRDISMEETHVKDVRLKMIISL